MYEKRCRLNNNGHYCGSFSDYFTDIREANAECLAGNDTVGCSDACRNKLEVLREDIGCCINEVLNNTRRTWLYPSLFNYTLWESCNLTTPSPSCLPSPLSRSMTTEKSKCSRDEIFEKSRLVLCNRTMLQPLLEMYDSHGCSAVGEDQMNICGLDENGKWCTKRFVSNIRTLSTLMVSAITHCPNKDQCSSNCKRSLLALNEVMGCCLTNLLNNTFVELVFADTHEYFRNYTSTELWKKCGIQHPRHCEVALSSAVGITEPRNRLLYTATVGVILCLFISLLLQ